MSLDGLRAWIGEVERKLGVRTRVFLVLTAIAIGGAGAAVYLGLDAKGDGVREADLQAVRQELQAEIDEVRAQASATGASEADPRVDSLEAQIRGLRTKIEALEEGGTTEPGRAQPKAGEGSTAQEPSASNDGGTIEPPINEASR